jgi:hypothetical protein
MQRNLLERVSRRYFDHDISAEQMYVENRWYHHSIHRLNKLNKKDLIIFEK